MPNARVIATIASFSATLIASAVSAAPPAHRPGAHTPDGRTGSGFQARWQIDPNDPLGGLPIGNENPDKTRDRPRRSLCSVDASAENNAKIGDLRAELAVVAHGGRSWPCPARSVQELRLRIQVDKNGTIVVVTTASGDTAVGEALSKRLIGKNIASRSEGGTEGIAHVSFTHGRG